MTPTDPTFWINRYQNYENIYFTHKIFTYILTWILLKWISFLISITILMLNASSHTQIPQKPFVNWLVCKCVLHLVETVNYDVQVWLIRQFEIELLVIYSRIHYVMTPAPWSNNGHGCARGTVPRAFLVVDYVLYAEDARWMLTICCQLCIRPRPIYLQPLVIVPIMLPLIKSPGVRHACPDCILLINVQFGKNNRLSSDLHQRLTP